MKKAALLLMALSGYAHGMDIPRPAIDMANRPMTNMNFGNSGPRPYNFKAFQRNNPPITFLSAIYTEDSENEFVRLDDEKFFDFSKSDGSKRYTQDFDSLVAFTVEPGSVPDQDGFTPAHTSNKPDTTWYPATVHGGQWIFRKYEGKVSLYTKEPLAGDFSHMSFRPDPIEPYNDSLFRSRLSENKECAALLSSRDAGKYTSIMAVVLGAVVALSGVLSSDEEVANPNGGPTEHEFNASPLIGIGLGVMAVSWIPYVIVKDNFAKAVYKYNF